MGYTVYDALVNWDLTSADKASDLVPGLATEWKVDDADQTKWVFKLRQGAKFHDGSEFKAAAVVWNLDKLLNDKSPQYDPKQAAQGRSRIPAVASYKAIDDYTLEVTTKEPDAFLPYQLAWILISSPAHWEEVGKDWNKFALQPSGTGPWKLDVLEPRERAEMVAVQGILGQDPRAEAGQAGAGADPGSRRPDLGAALRPGRLDRGPGARRDPEPASRPASRSRRTAIRITGRGI